MQTGNTGNYIPLLECLRKTKWFMRATAFSQIFCFLFVFYSPSAQAAAESLELQNTPQVIQGNTDEEKLANTLQAIKEDVGKTKATIEARLAAESSIFESILEFFGLSELQNESLNRLLDLNTQVEALNQKALANFAATEADLRAKGLPETVLQRHYQVVEKYKSDFQTLQYYIQKCMQAASLHEQQNAMDQLDGFLKQHQFKPAHQPLDPNNLPWGNPDADDTRKPKTNSQDLSEVIHGEPNPAFMLAKTVFDSVVKPAHADNVPGAGDLAETPDVKLTESIKLLAQQLNNNPVEIYNWVRNNIEFIPTYGSIQGANYTLQSSKGNAFDTASLLIALLRAADIPARYAYGTVDIPADQVMNWVGGVTQPAAALQLLGQGGIPNQGKKEGGVVASITMEHVWVEAWVDFEPGRGVNNIDGDSWVPLDASFKQYNYTDPALDISGLSYDGQALIDSLDSAALGDAALQSPEIDVALDNMLTAFDELSATQTPDGDINEQLGDKKLIVQEFKQLSPDLPYQLIAQTDSYSVIPETLRHKFRYQLGSENFNNTYIAYEVSLPEIAGKQLSVNYQPATLQDRAILESYIPDDAAATIDDLPSSFPGYLINLRGQFNIDGVPVLTSEADVFMMGEQVQHSTALYSPSGGWNQKNAKGTVGEHRAIGLDLQGSSNVEVEELKFDMLFTNSDLNNGVNASELNITEKLTQLGIHYYFSLNNRFNRQLSKPANVVNYRLPSFGYFHTALTPAYTFGTPVSVGFGGVVMDVPLLSKMTVAKDNSAATRMQYMRTNGLIASYLENWVPEQMFDTNEIRPQGVSAAKIMDIAATEGQQIFVITQANQADLANVNIDSATRKDILGAINAGKEVTVHQNPVSVNGWSGSGYIALDLNTGAGGYIISGGANGGFLSGLGSLGSLSFLLSMGLDFIPGIGQIKAIIELITGFDLITGEPISRWIAAAALLGVAGLAIGMILKLLSKLLVKVAKEIKAFIKTTNNTIGFTSDAAKVALSNVSRVDHASRHLIEAGLIQANPGSKAARQAFQEIGQSILTNPAKTFDHVMSRGGQAVKGFYGQVNGMGVIIFVAKEARGKVKAGDIVTSITPSTKQLDNFIL